MAPGTISERVAFLEARIEALHSTVFGSDGLQNFKMDMIAQITELKGDIKNLTWKVAFTTGAMLIIGNHLITWALSKIAQ